MTDISVTMEHIKSLCPSWKADVHLTRESDQQYPWSARVHDVWGHVHTPTFYGNSPASVLGRLETHTRDLVANMDEVAWVNDDGRVCNGEEGDAELYVDGPVVR